MKKTLLFIFILSALSSMAFNPQVAAVMSQGKVAKIYYGVDAMKQACIYSGVGDTVTVSAGVFNAPDYIYYGQTIQGVGYNVDENGKVSGTIVKGGFNISRLQWNGTLTFKGLYFDGDITFENATKPNTSTQAPANRAQKLPIDGTSNNIVFDKCRLNSFIFNDENWGYDYGLWLVDCRVADVVSSQGTVINIDNCIVNNIDCYDGQINNCLIFNVLSSTQDIGLTDCTINNTIFMLAKFESDFALDYSNTANNCLGVGADRKIFAQVTGANNKYIFITSNAFASYTSEYSDYETFPLTENTAANYLGTDGTQVGIHGGEYPYTQIPAYQRILDMNAERTVVDANTLPVDIRATDITTQLTYWIDDNYEDSVSVSGNAMSSVDISAVVPGAHMLRVFASGWNQSSISSVPFFLWRNLAPVQIAGTPIQMAYIIDGGDLQTTALTQNGDSYTGLIAAADYELGEHSISCWVVMSDGSVSLGYSGTFNRRDTEKCAMPVISYDGRYVTMTCEEQATIHFTLNGNDPTAASPAYESSIEPAGLLTVKAIAVRPEYFDSEIATFALPVYYAGGDLEMATAGTLAEAFGWTSTADITELTVLGPIDNSDIAFISQMPQLETVDLENAEIAALPANAFGSSPIYYIVLPESVTSAGANLFAGNKNIAAVNWTSSSALPAEALAGIDNPNLLLYVSNKNLAPANMRNVVANGTAASILLEDGGNFIVPIAFTAEEINYNHAYTQQTPIGGAAGWESLTLPYDVEVISYNNQNGSGQIKPFAALSQNLYDTYKPFWLYQAAASGFEAASEIKANTPYVISLPNNEAYADEFILAGNINFYSNYVTVPETNRDGYALGAKEFMPTTVAVAQSADVYALNVGEQYQDHEPGSVFLPNYKAIAPFQAYFTAEQAAQFLAIARMMGNEGTTALPQAMLKDSNWQVYAQGNSIVIATSEPKCVTIYNASGMAVRKVELNRGVNTVSGLAPGIYMVNSTKVMVK